MATTHLTNIIIYAFPFADRALREVPYLRYSAERSLGLLEKLRDPQLRIIVITSEPVDSYTLEYHFRDIFRFDDRATEEALKRLTLLTPGSREAVPLDQMVLRDDHIMDILKSAASDSNSVSIDNFSASDSLDKIAQQIGADIAEGNNSFVSRWGSKAGGKEVLTSAGVTVPRGTTEVLYGEAAVKSAINRLAHGPRPPRRALVKLNSNTWAASIGNVLVDCERLRRTGDLIASADVIRMPAEDFRHELHDDGAIAEEFIDGVISSPSGQGLIRADGSIEVTACHDQVLTDGQYWGCRFPVDEQWRPAITDAVGQVGAALASRGHRGTFGVDFVVADDGALTAVEVNLRKVGPSHVIQYVRTLVGGRFGRDGLLRRGDGEQVCYVHRRLLDPEHLGRLRPQAAVEALGEMGLLYRHCTGEGVVLHVLGALNMCGHVEVTAIGPTHEAAEVYCAKAAEVLGATRMTGT